MSNSFLISIKSVPQDLGETILREGGKCPGSGKTGEISVASGNECFTAPSAGDGRTGDCQIIVRGSRIFPISSAGRTAFSNRIVRIVFPEWNASCASAAARS